MHVLAVLTYKEGAAVTVVRHTEELEIFVSPEEWEPSVRRN